MHISDEILKETTLEDGSELKLTKNSLIHIGSLGDDSEIESSSSILSKFSKDTDKDVSLTDISLESIDAVRYSSQVQPRLTEASFGAVGLSIILSTFFWYQFGINGFSTKWMGLGVIVLLLGVMIAWALKEQVFIEKATIHLSSGETFKYARRVEEDPEKAPVELLWIVQEIRQNSYK